MNEKISKRWDKWSIKNGYSEPAEIPDFQNQDDIEKILKNESLPRRALAAGLMAGLTVVLNVEKEEYFCSGSESIGFKVCF